ncbi:MAG: hypothetical protein P3A58_06295 [Gemmatimonadota bacterium]|nr:hypothetical protein [Gemmatimonadota bacterium]
MTYNPNFLSDSSWRPLGSTTKNLLGQTELRTPDSIYRGSYDPAANVTRDADGFTIGNGNLLGSLIKRTFGL